MSLEEIEQKTLQYLKQVSNPLVRIEVLLDHLREDGALRDLDESRLIEFLDDHELFRIIEPLAPLGDVLQTEALSDADFANDRCVILDTRVPSQDHLLAMMTEQVSKMVDSLKAAFEEAKSSGDVGRMQTLQEILQRSSELQKKLATLVNLSAEKPNES